ncbi:MAG: cobalamin biosynthesis protein, partial [Chloroflexota bacterium]
MLTTLLLAFLLDLTAGDPPNRWHPVAWMGALIGRLQKVAPTAGDAVPFTAGAGIALGGGLLVWVIGRLIQRL